MSDEVLIENLLDTHERVPAPEAVRGWAAIPDQDTWNARLARDPLAFWKSCGERLAWHTPPAHTLQGGLGNALWYTGGRLNATVSCLDRNVASHPDATAYIYLHEN